MFRLVPFGCLHPLPWFGVWYVQHLLPPKLMHVVCACRAMGMFWKAARIGERLSPWVSISCVAMAISVLFFWISRILKGFSTCTCNGACTQWRTQYLCSFHGMEQLLNLYIIVSFWSDHDRWRAVNVFAPCKTTQRRKSHSCWYGALSADELAFSRWESSRGCAWLVRWSTLNTCTWVYDFYVCGVW